VRVREIGRTAHGRLRRLLLPWRVVLTNVDFLEWFSEAEREDCSDCGEHACVSFPGLPIAFCLACNTAKVDGKKIELIRPAA